MMRRVACALVLLSLWGGALALDGGAADDSKAEKKAAASEKPSKYDALFDLVDLAPKDSAISRAEWSEAAESGVLTIVAGKISSVSAAFSVATFNSVRLKEGATASRRARSSTCAGYK